MWCSNNVNVFNFHVGHDIPESKGGTEDISNLKPICDRCNLSMGNQNTINKWNQKYKKSNILHLYSMLIYVTLICFLLYNQYVIITYYTTIFNNIYSIFSGSYF